MSRPGCASELFTGKFSLFFSLSDYPTIWVGCYLMLAPSDCPQGIQAQSLTLSMQLMPPCPAPAYWWWKWVSGLLLHWELQLGAYSVCVCVCVSCFFFFCPPRYLAFWDSKSSHRPAAKRVSCCLEISPSWWLPPQDGSLSLTVLSLFLSFIFCPTSFWREWGAFLGAWCPLPVFRSCSVEVVQHSNDLLMNLWGRKWSPCPISLQS